MDQNIQRSLDEAFPKTMDAQLIRGVREGVLLADEVLDSEPIFRNLVGSDLRGHVRRAGVLFSVHNLCVTGDIPLTANMVPMQHGNWHWVELRSGKFVSHICRTASPGAFPEKTPNRQDCRLANQMDLFSPKVVSLFEVLGDVETLYAWLTYGVSPAGDIEHLCWAMPSAATDEWLARTDILGRSVESAEYMKPEAPPKTLKLRFKEQIEQAISKDGESSEVLEK